MVRFTHFFNFTLNAQDIVDKNFSYTSHFTTLYKRTIYQWAFEFEPTRSSNSIIIDQDEEREEHEAQMSLSLHNYSILRPSPEVNKVSFLLNLTYDGISENPPVSVFIPNHNLLEREDNYSPPADDRINRVIEELMFFQDPPDICEIRISVTLEIEDSSFEIGDFPKAAPSLPLHSDFRYSLVLDKSCHDLRIECADGVYTASRQALFVSCGYFRTLFNRSQPTVIQEPTTTVAAITTVLVHAVTGTFSPPERLTPKLLLEIYELYKRYDPSSFIGYYTSLSDALEKSCLEYLEACSHSLPDVVEWMVAASSILRDTLLHAAISIVLNFHFNTFVEEYGPDKQDRSEINQEVHMQWRGHRESSIYEYVMELRRNVVRAFDEAAPM